MYDIILPAIKSRLIACPINEKVFPTRFVHAGCKLGVQRVYERRLEGFAPYPIKVLENARSYSFEILESF